MTPLLLLLHPCPPRYPTPRACLSLPPRCQTWWRLRWRWGSLRVVHCLVQHDGYYCRCCARRLHPMAVQGSTVLTPKHELTQSFLAHAFLTAFVPQTFLSGFFPSSLTAFLSSSPLPFCLVSFPHAFPSFLPSLTASASPLNIPGVRRCAAVCGAVQCGVPACARSRCHHQPASHQPAASSGAVPR